MSGRAPGLLALASAVVLLAACRGEVRPVGVGSKNFTEQLILGEVLATLLEEQGVPVVRKLNLEGTFLCHQAIQSGDIDVYVEYSGTALAAILKLPLTHGGGDVFRTVREEYRRRYNLDWGEPLGFNNTFALVMRRAHAEALGVKKISDLLAHAGTIRTGFGYEFMEREDGLAGLRRAYGLNFAVRPKEMTLTLIYQALAENEVDLVAGNSTDGLIDLLDLMVLEDDRHFFPPYEAAPVVRPAALARHPALGAVLAELAGRVDEGAMRALNRAVDSERRSPREVARGFVKNLKEVGGRPSASGAPAAAAGRLTPE